MASQAIRNEKAFEAPSTIAMLPRKSGYTAPSAGLRGSSPTTESDAAPAEAPNAIRNAPLRAS